MNCSQARALLATYRELSQDQTHTQLLEEHLAQCSDCRTVSVQDAFIGKSLRALPRLEPLPDAHTKLMQALAVEHVRFIQHTSASVTLAPTPAFLASYVKELAQQSVHQDTIVTFSTADTGPLPLIPPGRRPSFYHMNNFAILGLAASVLMVLMIGGVTSLLLLANQNSGGASPNISRTNTDLTLSQVLNKNYSTLAPYAHVASALANNNTIYYTAYDNSTTGWMLEAFDNQTNNSTPLLATASSSPLIIEGVYQNYLVWLQVDPAKVTGASASQDQTATSNPAQTWSLYTRFLGKAATPDATTAADVPLYSDTFHPNSVPAWVHGPFQGITFTQNALLVSLIDSKGISHLWSYPVDYTQNKVTATATEIAQAKNGHILAFPTATSDGTDIYWADEWWSNTQNALASNIWTQQLAVARPAGVGRWAAHMATSTYLFRANEHSFHPQLIQNTLFLLTTSAIATKNVVTPTPIVVSTQATSTAPSTTTTTSTATATSTATPTAQSVDIAGVLGGEVRVDPTIMTPQIDMTISGTLLSFSANGALPYPAPTDHIVSALQGGSRFLIWQNSANEFEMYDAVAKTSVAIEANMVSKDAAFLAVNSNIAVWVVNPASSTTKNGQMDTNVRFQTFAWPVLLKSVPGS